MTAYAAGGYRVGAEWLLWFAALTGGVFYAFALTRGY